jgi:hypothetical protein
MTKTNTGPRYLRLQRYWFENQASTQHVSTWADICDSLRIDDEPEDIETIALKVSVTTYRVPNTTDIRILE